MTRVVVAGEIESDEGHARATLRHVLQPALGAALLALAFALVGLLSMLLRAVDTTVYRPDDAWLVVLVLLASLPIAVVHRWPFVALVVVMAAMCVQTIAGYELVGIGVWAGGAALFVTAAFDDLRNAILAALVAAGGLLVVILTEAGGLDYEMVAVAWGAYSFDWTVALLIRVYRSSASRAETRAALFAADREARAREAVANERVRLARELHDSVGHALNVIVLHAGGARRVLETKPELAADALGNIETAGRQALADIERMLGILRAEDDETSFNARPGLARLDDLLGRVREAGLPVEMRVVGEPRELPASLDLTAYRIVQEALTNTLKHAGKAHSIVTLVWGDEQLDIEVVDDGHGAAAPASPGGGRGLVGIRERVLLFGGELYVGVRPTGGFGVWARLPYGTMAGAPPRHAAGAEAPADAGGEGGPSEGETT